MKPIKVNNETHFADMTKEQLIADLKVVMSDAEALIQATAHQGGEALATVRIKAEESIAQAKAKMINIEDALRIRTQAAVDATDVYVHENPWQAVGIGAGLGLVIGFLIARR